MLLKAFYPNYIKKNFQLAKAGAIAAEYAVGNVNTLSLLWYITQTRPIKRAARFITTGLKRAMQYFQSTNSTNMLTEQRSAGTIG